VAFVIAYDGGGYALASRTSTAIALWWAVFLGLGLGLVRLGPVPRAALAVGGLLTAFAALTLGSAWWAPSAEDVFVEFNRASLYLGAFVLVVLVSRRLRADAWLDGLAIAIVAIAAIALASRFFPDLFSERGLLEFLPSSRKRLSFPLDYWNGLGVLCGLAVPLLLRVAVAAGNTIARAAAVAPFPALGAAVYLASSRGGAGAALAGGLAFAALTRRRWEAFGAVAVAAVGIAGVAVVLHARDELVNLPVGADVADQGRSAALLVGLICVGCGVVYWAALRRMPSGVQIPRPVGWATAAALVLVALAAVAAADPVAQLRTFRDPPTVNIEAETDFVERHLLSGSGTGRWQFWETALDEFAAHPVTGGGAGSFEAWWAEHGSLPLFVRDAHSLYFETLAELGVAGLVLVTAVLIVGIASGIRRRPRAPESSDAVAAATAALIAFALAAGIDWMWEVTVVTLVAVACLALVTGPATVGVHEEAPGGGPSPRTMRALAVATAVIALVAIAAQGISLLTAVQIEESQAAARRDDLVRAADRADAARHLQPWASSPYLQLALIAKDAGDYSRGRVWIAEAIERDERNWRLWLVKAQLETPAGAIREACVSLLRAAELNPRSPLFADVRDRECG